mmetsp:Transcript_2706/g.6894  ORF Transcript_2706/g.6894 Transcript_2706/m.6894 type:complete len:220 (+) Transcript_2706:48-707(+)
MFRPPFTPLLLCACSKKPIFMTSSRLSPSFPFGAGARALPSKSDMDDRRLRMYFAALLALSTKSARLPRTLARLLLDEVPVAFESLEDTRESCPGRSRCAPRPSAWSCAPGRCAPDTGAPDTGACGSIALGTSPTLFLRRDKFLNFVRKLPPEPRLFPVFSTLLKLSFSGNVVLVGGERGAMTPVALLAAPSSDPSHMCEHPLNSSCAPSSPGTILSVG